MPLSSHADPMSNASVLPYLEKRWRKVGRRHALCVTDKPAYQRWRRGLVRKLKELTGYDTMVKAPLRPRITEEKSTLDYTRQRVEIQTEPGVVMPMYVLVPRQGDGPFPVMLAPHGHSAGGKLLPSGCRDIPEVSQAIDHFNYDYGVSFVRAGFITFCPDARGFGERRLPRDMPITKSACQWIHNMAIPLGQTVTGMWAWDLHRLIDYVQTRRDCDATRLGCAGLSGGGLQTLWATALDKRIRCAIVSGYFYGYRESLLQMHQNCSCNYVPHLYENADMGDIGALVAPRPLMIETGDRDPLNGGSGLKNVKPQVAITRKAYHLLGATDRLKHVIFHGEHRWDGAKAVPWLNRWLG